MTASNDKAARSDAHHAGKNRGRGQHRPFGRGPRTAEASGSVENASADSCIYGLHAAEFALLNPRREVLAISATENAERKLSEAIGFRQGIRSVSIERVAPRDLDRRLGADTVHQGIALEVAPLATYSIEDLAERGVRSGQPIVVLDQVTDPHNVGAVLRSSAVFGAAGVIMTQRHSPPLGGSLAKAASGALDLMPVCLVQNLGKALTELRKQTFEVIGLDGGDGHRLLQDGLGARRGRPLVLALGAEGKGLRELSRQSCDELCRIGGEGPIASLNVSNAAAIALHLAAMLRP